MNIYQESILAVLAIFFITVGLILLFSGRPIIISGKLFLWLIIGGLLPQFYKSMQVLIFDVVRANDTVDILLPVLWGLVVAVAWRRLNGYVVIGISAEPLRESIIYALKQMDIPFERQRQTIRLLAVDDRLEIYSHNWVDTGLIKLVKVSDPIFLRTIITRMDQYYQENEIPPSLKSATAYLLLGGLFGLFPILSRFILL